MRMKLASFKIVCLNYVDMNESLMVQYFCCTKVSTGELHLDGILLKSKGENGL